MEDVYEYDFPRPVVPPAPARRALSDIGGPSAAFSNLNIDSAVDPSMCGGFFVVCFLFCFFSPFLISNDQQVAKFLVAKRELWSLVTSY